MADMECCITLDCDNCSRELSPGCYGKLFKDAISIIRMQRSAIKRGNDAIDSLSQTVKIYEGSCKIRVEMKDVVKMVNEIIECSFDADDCGDYMGNLISVCQEFITLLELDGGQVAFDASSRYPKIQMQKD
jgi:hypothetical protein